MKFHVDMAVGCLKNGEGNVSQIITNEEGDVSIVVKFPHTEDIYYEDGYLVDHADHTIPHLYSMEKYLRIKAISLE